MNSKRFGTTLLTFLVMGCAATAQVKGSHPSEQTHFSAEVEGVDKPVTLPQDVVAILGKDEMVRNALENENVPAEKMPLSWFSASAIHLSNSGKVDLVVAGNPPLAGANVTTFWVFRATPHGYELVLNAPAHDLAVMNTRSRGYRDIELISMTAVQMSSVLCRFDGARYTKYKARSEPIRSEPIR
ncbi:MAG TPA: hypothetical protein VKE93_05325 [Candidatus Angelobacter sp.]|nr:hypothetical protein [Candidatus Angelobacter sp.]